MDERASPVTGDRRAHGRRAGRHLGRGVRRARRGDHSLERRGLDDGAHAGARRCSTSRPARPATPGHRRLAALGLAALGRRDLSALAAPTGEPLARVRAVRHRRPAGEHGGDARRRRAFLALDGRAWSNVYNNRYNITALNMNASNTLGGARHVFQQPLRGRDRALERRALAVRALE
jgi:hypothetical protein